MLTAIQRQVLHNDLFLIDTGSTRTLVTSALMDRLNVEFSKATDSGGNIVSLDGSPLPVLGAAKLVMSRMAWMARNVL